MNSRVSSLLASAMPFIHKYLVILILVPVAVFGAFKHWPDQGSKILTSDQEGYYIYLPASIIYGSFENVPCISGCTVPDASTGLVHTKYTYGVALMELPFFLGAHLACQFLDYDDDGRSPPYAWSILMAAIFYLGLAIIILQKVLGKWFSEKATVVALISICLGTNLFYYSSGEPGMSHVYSFFLFAMGLSLIHSWQEQPSKMKAAFLCLVISLAILIRPTNVIFLVCLPLIGISSVAEFKSRVAQLFKSGIPVMLPVFTAVLFFPQFKYWELFTGEFLSYSYGNEGFKYWLSPKILSVLFSHQNGLLMYSPILVLPIFGLAPLWKKQSGTAIAIILGLTLATYAFASWWAWWFGGAYGHRAFIEYFALLAIPMAAFWESAFQLKLKWRLGLLTLTAILVCANLRMSMIYFSPWDGPDWTWNRFIEVWLSVFQFT